MTSEFNGKTAIVTGGTSGIGLGLCEELLKRGAYVYVIGSRESSLAKIKEQFAKYPNARFAAVDVRDNAAVEKMVKDCVAEFGRLDYLFNNAGISQNFPYEKVTLDLWKDMIDINLWGVVYGINAALAVMRKQGSGHIVNTSSYAAIACNAYQPVYVATKCAVLGMTKSLRYEYEPKNIFFTAVCPSYVVTPIFKTDVIPEHAISVEDAIPIILDGVLKKELVIILPEYFKEMAEKSKDPVFYDAEMKKYELERRQVFMKDPEYERQMKIFYSKDI